MEEVKENPWSEICWYMPESREQYRLSGKLYIIKSDEKDEELKKVRSITSGICCKYARFLCQSSSATAHRTSSLMGCFATCNINVMFIGPGLA